MWQGLDDQNWALWCVRVAAYRDYEGDTANEPRGSWRASLTFDKDRQEWRDFRRPRSRLQWQELLNMDFDSVRKGAFSSPLNPKP